MSGLLVGAGGAAVVTGATDGRDMDRQRQLTVDDNTERGVRDGDARAEHQDVMAVDLVRQLLTRAEPQQLRLRRVQSKSARTQPDDVMQRTC